MQKMCQHEKLPWRIVEGREKFSVQENHSNPEPIIGRCIIPIPVGDGHTMDTEALVVDGDVPVTIGKDTLLKYKGI